MEHAIRVLLVDDHTLFRSGVKALLQRQSDFEIVGEASDGLEGIKRARSLKPDLVLLDLHMPGVSPLNAELAFALVTGLTGVTGPAVAYLFRAVSINGGK